MTAHCGRFKPRASRSEHARERAFDSVILGDDRATRNGDKAEEKAG
jgi:hypothetical protein